MRYYELVSRQYLFHPSSAAPLLELHRLLWDNLQYQVISSLVLYQWVSYLCFELSHFTRKLFVHGSHGRDMLFFIKSCDKLFWIDITNSRKRFAVVMDVRLPFFWSSTFGDEAVPT